MTHLFASAVRWALVLPVAVAAWLAAFVASELWWWFVSESQSYFSLFRVADFPFSNATIMTEGVFCSAAFVSAGVRTAPSHRRSTATSLFLLNVMVTGIPLTLTSVVSPNSMGLSSPSDYIEIYVFSILSLVGAAFGAWGEWRRKPAQPEEPSRSRAVWSTLEAVGRGNAAAQTIEDSAASSRGSVDVDPDPDIANVVAVARKSANPTAELALVAALLATEQVSRGVKKPDRLSDWKLRTEFLAFFLHAADRTAFEVGGASVRDAIIGPATTIAASKLVSSTWSRKPGNHLPIDWEERTLKETIRNIAAADAEYGQCSRLLPESDEAMLQAVLGSSSDRSTVLIKLADVVNRENRRWDPLLVMAAATHALVTTEMLQLVTAEAKAQRTSQVSSALGASGTPLASEARSPWERPRGD